MLLSSQKSHEVDTISTHTSLMWRLNYPRLGSLQVRESGFLSLKASVLTSILSLDPKRTEEKKCCISPVKKKKSNTSTQVYKVYCINFNYFQLDVLEFRKETRIIKSSGRHAFENCIHHLLLIIATQFLSTQLCGCWAGEEMCSGQDLNESEFTSLLVY